MTWAIVIVAGLLAVVALGLLLRGQAPPPKADDMVKDVPTADQTAPAPAPTPAVETTPPSAKDASRKSPDAPLDLPDDAYTATPSGLKIHVVQEGTGPSPQPGQTVKVDYTGWLTNGTRFDSSLDRAEPIVFAVGTGLVIKGWDEALLGMKVGGKEQIVVPPDLAYGEKGRPPVIPPTATLIFDVELVGVE